MLNYGWGKDLCKFFSFFLRLLALGQGVFFVDKKDKNGKFRLFEYYY